MSECDDPLNPNLQLAEPPFLRHRVSPGSRPATAQEIVLRLARIWKVVRPKTLGIFSGYGQRVIEDLLPRLEEEGLIKSLGSPLGGRKHKGKRTGERLYARVSFRPDDALYDFTSRLRCECVDPTGLRHTSGIETSGELMIPAHEYYVAEVAAWLANGFAKQGNTCLALPEQLLRKGLGWYSHDKKNSNKNYFLTPIPDAWMIFGCYSFRLEVQLSPTDPKNVIEVCESSPLREPVLYVVKDERLHRQLLPLSEQIPNFFLARFGCEADLAKIHLRYQGLVNKREFKSWAMRDYYAGEDFVRAIMKVETADRFCASYKAKTAILRADEIRASKTTA
jgi:hypothetical protein